MCQIPIYGARSDGKSRKTQSHSSPRPARARSKHSESGGPRTSHQRGDRAIRSLPSCLVIALATAICFRDSMARRPLSKSGRIAACRAANTWEWDPNKRHRIETWDALARPSNERASCPPQIPRDSWGSVGRPQAGSVLEQAIMKGPKQSKDTTPTSGPTTCTCQASEGRCDNEATDTAPFIAEQI